MIMFFICWAPFHAQRLLYIYGEDNYPDLNEALYMLSGCLYYFSTTVNPILYNLMSVKYRRAFKQTIYCGYRKLSTRSCSAKESQIREGSPGGKAHNSNFKNSVR